MKVKAQAAQRIPYPAMANRDAIRVMLADDHAMVRQGLRSLLQNHKNVDVVGEDILPSIT